MGAVCVCYFNLPEAKAEERMAAIWATLRLRVSDMVVDKASSSVPRHPAQHYTGYVLQFWLYKTHARQQLQEYAIHHSTPSGISAMSSSIKSQFKSTGDNGLSGCSLDDPEDNDSTAYEDSLVLPQHKR